MELWFIAAVSGVIVSGLSNFFFKIAATKECNAELFIFYNEHWSWYKVAAIGLSVASLALLG